MFICVNGKIQAADAPAIMAGDRSYRYGDGLFETMKMVEGEIQLADLHFNRLFAGIQKMNMDWPVHLSREKLSLAVKELCKKNACEKYGRIRLSISAGEGGLFDPGRKAHYCIEAWPLSPEMGQLNSNGLVIGVFENGRKSNDGWSNLKSSSCLLYSMAAIEAKEKHWNDALLLNTEGTIADTCIANIFIVKNGVICTTRLKDGCVDGVMRTCLLGQLAGWGFSFEERSLYPSDLATADEIFLTNAIRGIRWVKQLGDHQYGHSVTLAVFQKLQTIWK